MKDLNVPYKGWRRIFPVTGSTVMAFFKQAKVGVYPGSNENLLPESELVKGNFEILLTLDEDLHI